jgi:hypothetical protein
VLRFLVHKEEGVRISQKGKMNEMAGLHKAGEPEKDDAEMTDLQGP